MRTSTLKRTLLIAVATLVLLPVSLHAEENVIVVIIDGARYSETLGDPNASYTPHMARLAELGTIVDPMLNDSATWTSRAVPALWSGDWTAPRDTFYNMQDTQYTLVPSMFEYYRKQTGAPETDCYYVLKYINSLWLPSFEPDYGPDYWPRMHSVGSTDAEVFEEAKDILQSDHPHLMWLYFADVDHYGHTGVWEDYTRAIEIADSLVEELWGVIQGDEHYRNKTALIVTNDHGRHNNRPEEDHDGFSGHGDGCPGCRQIMFLGVGPSFLERNVSMTPRTIPDIAVTAASLLNVEMPYSSGEVMTELLNVSGLPDAPSAPRTFTLLPILPNPTNSTALIRFDLARASVVSLTVYDLLGRPVAVLLHGAVSAGGHEVVWQSGSQSSGTYLVRMESGLEQRVRKVVLVK